MPADPSLVQVVALIVVAALAFGAVLLIPRIWRGELQGVYDDVSRDVWLWGEPMRRGFLRALPLGILLAVVGVLLGFAAVVQAPTANMGPVVGTAVGVFFGLLALNASVILFNRPRWAVPPHVRDQPGAVREWRARFRERRQQRRTL